MEYMLTEDQLAVKDLARGYMYENGQGVRQDHKQAISWYTKAAEQKNSNAQIALGNLYRSGEGVKQNNATAKELYGKACDNGSQDGCDEYRKLNETELNKESP